MASGVRLPYLPSALTPMATTDNSSTYAAAKATGSPLNWRGTYSLSTSSRLTNQTIKAITSRQIAEAAAVVELSEKGDYSFFNGIESGLGALADTFLTPSAQASLTSLDEQIFSLQGSLNLFETSLIASKSLLDIKFYSDCLTRFKELQSIVLTYKQKTAIDPKIATDVIVSQVQNIKNLNGISGKTLVGNLLNQYLSESSASSTGTITLIVSILQDFLPTGVYGQTLLELAESIIGASLSLLETAHDNFLNNTKAPLSSLDEVLAPVFGGLGRLVSGVKSTIAGELSNITNGLIGNNSTVDAAISNGIGRIIDNGVSRIGLSLNDSSGRQLQPLAGKYSVESGVRIASGTFVENFKNELNFSAVATSPDSLNGVNSILPSMYINNTISHPRETRPQESKNVSSSSKINTYEISQLKLNIIDSYRKMPGAAISNPELANGVSLSSVVFEDEALSNVDNLNIGTTVGSLTSVVRTTDQVFVNRLR